jgi:ABC-type multidrug transport system ATPase subunit
LVGEKPGDLKGGGHAERGFLMVGASPLTVWLGSTKYVFPPGRDVIVGCGKHCDIPLDRLGPHDHETGWRSSPDLLLRFTGTHWVAIDRGRDGMFVNGARMATVDIHDGQAITIGHPERGPRLQFQTVGPAGPPPRPTAPPQPPPTEPGTLPMPTIAPQYPPMERPTRPFKLPPHPPPAPPPAPAPHPARPAPPPVPLHEPAKSRGLVERMTDATRKLRPARPDTGADEVMPSTNRLPLKPGARTIGVAAYRLGLVVHEREVLSDVSFTAHPGSMIAVTGPSAARNSALIGLLAGAHPPTYGVLTVDGHDVQAEPESMRSRIGAVPRDDRVHPCLTVERALGYAAEMRLPPDTSPDNRRRVVSQVLDELELTPHRKTRVAKLPPVVRRCASMAIELVTRPSLLVVDEPSAGLDPAQEDHVMAMLRRQADLGCVVVIATTSLAHLHMCDQVLLLTPAGTLAFAGPPWQMEPALGTTDWYEVFARISADPFAAHHSFLSRQQSAPAEPAVVAPEPPPAEFGLKRQIRLVVRRQARLLVAYRIYFLFLVLLPFAFGALTLLIPGDSGFDRPAPGAANRHEAIEILAALNIGAVIMGTALTIRDLVRERRIFRREQAIGLSTTAYLVGKLIVFGQAAAIQASILTTFVLVVKGRPVHGAAALQSPGVELYLSVGVMAIVSAIVGLAMSSLGKSLREVVPLVVPVVLASLLFAGGLLPLVGKWVFDQISWFVPAQWGFAASASTVNLRRVDTLAPANAMWTHYAGWWVFDMLMLVVFGALWAGFVWYRLRPPIRSDHMTFATSKPTR